MMGANLRLVSIESPCRGAVQPWVPERLKPLAERYVRRLNMRYAMLCVRDSLQRGEAPYASHVFFDRPGLLDDADPRQRKLGIEVGLTWSGRAQLFAFYLDLGWSEGMQRAHREAAAAGIAISERYLYAPSERPGLLWSLALGG